jgi:hypothetical protein
MRGAIPPLPNTPSWRGAQLKIAQGQLHLTFTFYPLDTRLNGSNKSYVSAVTPYPEDLKYIVSALPTDRYKRLIHYISVMWNIF